MEKFDTFKEKQKVGNNLHIIHIRDMFATGMYI